MALQRYTFNLEENLMAAVDKHAESLHINRTAAVSVLLSRALQQEKTLDALHEIAEAAKEQRANILIEQQ